MPAGTTYEVIASYTFASAATSFTFSSIPQTYTDLQVIWSAKETTTSGDGRMYMNGDSTFGNYIWSRGLMEATGAAPNEVYAYSTQNNASAHWVAQNSMNSAYYQAGQIDIFNYTSTNMFKNSFAKIGSGYANQTAQFFMNTWENTSAVTSIEIFATGPTLTVGTTMTLYGIKAA
jgi:hypothetical protein